MPDTALNMLLQRCSENMSATLLKNGKLTSFFKMILSCKIPIECLHRPFFFVQEWNVQRRSIIHHTYQSTSAKYFLLCITCVFIIFCFPAFERTCVQSKNLLIIHMKKYAMKSFSFYIMIPVIFTLLLRYSVKLSTLLMLWLTPCF